MSLCTIMARPEGHALQQQTSRSFLAAIQLLCSNAHKANLKELIGTNQQHAAFLLAELRCLVAQLSFAANLREPVLVLFSVSTPPLQRGPYGALRYRGERKICTGREVR
jgi:hypothetical protein